MAKKEAQEQAIQEVFDFRSIFRPRKRQLEIWVDSDRKVHSNASGSITSQMKALSAMIEYIQMYATMCQDVSAKALNTDNSLIEMNERLSRQLQTATNTLAVVDKDLKRKAVKNPA
jgi:hypothetical protein